MRQAHPTPGLSVFEALSIVEKLRRSLLATRAPNHITRRAHHQRQWMPCARQISGCAPGAMGLHTLSALRSLT